MIQTEIDGDLAAEGAIGAKRAVLIVDEMQNIPHELYPVFMSLASDVRKAGMVTHVLSIGQPEMKATIDLVFQSNYLQTIGRFFQGMEVYHGLTLEDVSALLKSVPPDPTAQPAFASLNWTAISVIGVLVF